MISGEDKAAPLKTPPHLGHLEHHPNAAFEALKWTLRVKRKAKEDKLKMAVIAEEKEEEEKADEMAKHMTVLQEERAVLIFNIYPLDCCHFLGFLCYKK